MEWLTSLFNGATAGVGGVITGAIGGVFGQIGKYYQEKLRQSHEKDKWKHDKEMASLDISARADIAKGEALSNSIESDASLSNSNTSPWANNIKVVFRPFLTTLLIFVATLMFLSIMSAFSDKAHSLNNAFSTGEMREIIRYMIYTVFYTASTAAMWWFCDRALTPKFAK